MLQNQKAFLYTSVTSASSCEFLASGVSDNYNIVYMYVRMYANIASKTLHFATYALRIRTYVL